MTALLSFHIIAAKRGDGLLPELAELYERPIPRLAKPIDVLPDSEATKIAIALEIPTSGERN